MILLDIGSTLIDSSCGGPKGRLASALGIVRSRFSELSQAIFCSLAQTPSELGSELAARFGKDQDHCIEVVDRLWSSQLEEAFVLPGASKFIAECRQAGLQRAYLSNTWPPFYEHFTRCFPEESKQPRFLSFEQGKAKPDAEAFQIALRTLSVEPQQTVMVGDTYYDDIAPAIALGLKTVWVLHRPLKEKQALIRVLNRAAAAPDWVIGSIAELTPERLQKLLPCA